MLTTLKYSAKRRKKLSFKKKRRKIKEVTVGSDIMHKQNRENQNIICEGLQSVCFCHSGHQRAD